MLPLGGTLVLPFFLVYMRVRKCKSADLYYASSNLAHRTIFLHFTIFLTFFQLFIIMDARTISFLLHEKCGQLSEEGLGLVMQNLNDRAFKLILGIADMTTPNSEVKCSEKNGTMTLVEYDMYRHDVKYNYNSIETRFFKTEEAAVYWQNGGYSGDCTGRETENHTVQRTRMNKDQTDRMPIAEWNKLQNA